MTPYNDFIARLAPKPITKLDKMNEKFKELKDTCEFDDEYDDIAFICLANKMKYKNVKCFTYFIYNDYWTLLEDLHLNINFLMEVVFGINQLDSYGIRIYEDNSICITDKSGSSLYWAYRKLDYEESKQQIQKTIVKYFKGYCEDMKEVVE